jgi:hypothetical protein
LNVVNGARGTFARSRSGPSVEATLSGKVPLG